MPARRPVRTRFAFACTLLGAVATLVATAAATPSARVESPGTWCGGRLWRLMTLSDPARTSVDLRGEPTTIAKIGKLAAPAAIAAKRQTALQRHVWRLQAVVDRYRIASNGEIVLILFSIDAGEYMNVYLPNPVCLGERARY